MSKDKIKKNQFHNILTFLLLFSEPSRLLKSSPDYIIEKFKRYCGDPKKVLDNNNHEWGIHPITKQVIEQYINIWNSQIQSLKRQGIIDDIINDNEK